MQQIAVRVPASTSNLGPGFDCLGIALRIYNTITIAPDELPRQLQPPIVSEAADLFFKQARRRAFSFSCSIMEQIPRSRGLGSSATIRLGALLALNRLSGDPLDRFAIVELCSQLEKHPDNAAPACYGGFNVVRGLDRQMFTLSAQLHFVLLVPNFEISTAAARRLLPSRVDRLDAVENSRNACAPRKAKISG